MKFQDIENAFMFVSTAPQFENSAILSKETGEIYYVSGIGDSDELPDDVEDADKYIEIPHKNDLDLGKALVLEFVSEYLPGDFQEVTRIFNRKGAYARFKQLLESKGMLDQWYAYEESKQEAALREWCTENGIEVMGKIGGHP
jgi:hypothetical protein